MFNPIKHPLGAVTRRLFRIVPAIALAAMGLAHAQTWPTPGKPVHIVVPFSPGGTTDLLGRMLAQQLAQNTGGQFVVDSKPGASGSLGSMEVARAAPDGYTLLVSTSSTHSIPQAFGVPLRYDAVKDFTPIAHLADADNLILGSPTLGVTNLKELIDLARRKPGYINYTSTGVGSIAHLFFEALKAETGVFMTHIPYKGSGGAVVDLMSGTVHLSFDSVPTAAPHVKEKRLLGLATTGRTRNALTPDIATVAETVKGFAPAPTWFGLSAPRGMSPDLVRRIHEEVTKAMRSREMLERFKAMGLEPGRGSAAEFSAMMTGETARWAKVVKERNIKLE